MDGLMKIYNNMLGAITGDNIGSVYEFHNTKDYKFCFGKQRLYR